MYSLDTNQIVCYCMSWPKYKLC